MGDFNRDRRGSEGRDFQKRDFGSRSFDRPQVMHKTICSSCGKECEVPFKPNGSKPVFCRDCFQNNRPTESGRPENFPRRSNFEDRSNTQTSKPLEQPRYKQDFEILNTKLDQILNLLTPKETFTEVVTTEPIQVPDMEVPIIKKKRVSKK